MIYFVGAGPGDIELITVKGRRYLQDADVVLYTGSLVPKEMLTWCKSSAIIESSENMTYAEIFEFLLRYKDVNFVRLHTGDPSIYSTIAKQIEFLKANEINYEVVPGVTAAFAAAAALGIEYTIPGVSQTIVISRVEGNTPNPQSLESILSLKNSSFVFYLSIKLIAKLQECAKKLGYADMTPCFVVEKASWSTQAIYYGTLADIHLQISHIKGVAVILMGDFLNQKELCKSGLYSAQ
ncbi:MAG: cobalt precorrin-4 (C11)-methyltransferase [Pseudomonadota bacterium]|jgi:precorrin-4/cobalt-precorrin-4 C11-methyltransferase